LVTFPAGVKRSEERSFAEAIFNDQRVGHLRERLTLYLSYILGGLRRFTINTLLEIFFRVRFIKSDFGLHDQVGSKVCDHPARMAEKVKKDTVCFSALLFYDF